jgi:hypothetical protein
MAKPPTPTLNTIALTPRERVLLFCAGSGTDWKRAGVPSETVTALIVRGLLVRDGVGRLALTNSGREALRGLLPGSPNVTDETSGPTRTPPLDCR